MGQKIHPGGMRVGVIHDWKSNWYTGKKEFPAYLIEDIRIRDHITNKLSHAGLSDILIRKDKQRITVDIYTARPQRFRRRAPEWRAPGGPEGRAASHRRAGSLRRGPGAASCRARGPDCSGPGRGRAGHDHSGAAGRGHHEARERGG